MAFFDPYNHNSYDYKMDANLTTMFSAPYHFQMMQHPYAPPMCFDPYAALPMYCYQPTPTTSTPSSVDVTTVKIPSDELRAESEDNVTSTRRPSKRGRPTKNPVWSLFTRVNDKTAKCNRCQRTVKSACATNMTKHVERHHNDASFFINSTSLQSSPNQISVDDNGSDDVNWSTPKRFRRTKHPVWELFVRCADGTAQCVLCSSVVRSPCSSNFMGHLNRHHIEHYQSIYNRWLNHKIPQTPSEQHMTIVGVVGPM